MVTEVRIILTSCLAWAIAIIFSSQSFLPTAVLAVSETLLLIPLIYFNVPVYKEVGRNEKQIAANQVSLDSKEKLLKKRKAFYTTIIVLLAIFLCCIPTNICLLIMMSFKERISPNTKVTAVYILSLLPVLNSMFNPLIYAARIRYFRLAFIQLLSRKTATQSEELERKMFRTRQIEVNGNVNAGQGSQALDDNDETTRQAEPHCG